MFSKPLALARLFSLCVLAIISGNALGTTLTKIGEWGQNEFTSATKIGSHYYFSQRNSQKLAVYSTLEDDPNSFIGELEIESIPDIETLATVNNHLIVVSYDAIRIYLIEDVFSAELIYAVNINDSSYSQEALKICSGSIFYVNADLQLYMIEFFEDAYSLTGVYSTGLNNNESNYSYFNQQTINCDESSVFVASEKNEYIDDSRTSSIVAAKFNFSLDTLEQEYSFEEILDTDSTWVRSISPLTNNFFAVQIYGEELRVYGDKDDEFTLLSETQLDSLYSDKEMAMISDYLWILDEEGDLSKYEVTNSGRLELESSQNINFNSSRVNYFDFSVAIENSLVVLHSRGLHEIRIRFNEYFSDTNVFYQGQNLGGLEVRNGYMYLPYSTHIDIVDVSNPSELKLGDQYQLGSFENYTTYKSSMMVDDSYYLISGYELVRFLVEPDGSLDFQAELSNASYFSSFARKDGYLFNTQDNYTVERYDLTGPNSMYEFPETVNGPAADESWYSIDDAEVSGNHYIGVDRYSSGRLLVFENALNNIKFDTSIEVDSYIWNVDSLGDYFYLSGSDSSDIKVYKSGENFEYVSSFRLNNNSRYFSIFDKYLITDSSYSGDFITRTLYSLEDPENPVFLSSTVLDEAERLYDEERLPIVYNDGMVFVKNEDGSKVYIYQINQSPILEETSYTLEEDGYLSIDLSSIDPEGESVTLNIVSETTSGILDFDEETQSLTYTPNTNFFGSDSASLDISDQSGNYISVDLTFTIQSVNDAPLVEPFDIDIEEDFTFAATLEVVDPDDTEFSFNVVTSPSNGSLSVAEGELNYTPELNYFGDDSFTISVTDDGGATSETEFSVTIAAVNDAPILEGAELSVQEDSNLTSTFSATDAEGESIFYAVTSEPASGSLVVDELGTYTYTPDADYFGSDQFSMSASDNQGGISVAEFTVVVEAVNDSPEFQITSVTALEDTVTEAGPLASDVDGDELSYNIVSAPSQGTAVVSENGTLAYNPSDNFVGDDELTVSVTDGVSDPVEQVIVIAIDPVNDAPILNSTEITIEEDETSTVALDIYDPENNDITLSIASLPAELTSAEYSEGNLTIEPVKNYFGSFVLTITLTDNLGATSSFDLSITVTAVEDSPETTDTTSQLTSGTSFSGSLPTADVDNDILSYSIVTNVQNGTLELSSSGEYIYTPNAGFSGNDEFTYQVNDGKGNTAEGKVSFNVQASQSQNNDQSSNNATSGDSGGGSLNLLWLLLASCCLIRLNSAESNR